jgi:DNA polymerase-3 subunit epsilon
MGGWLTSLRRARAPESDEPSRWVVVDVETSGLDAARDRLLAIAGIALRVDWPRKRLAMDAADSFEVVLRQQEASAHDNILLHGIGAQRQREGMPARDALLAFQAYAGGAPLLAFHAAFDQTLIGRYAQAELGAALRNDWLDIEHLCTVTHPAPQGRSLDDWLARFGILCLARHEAAADTWAEGELLLRIWPRVAAEARNWAQVRRLARHHRWLARK